MCVCTHRCKSNMRAVSFRQAGTHTYKHASVVFSSAHSHYLKAVMQGQLTFDIKPHSHKMITANKADDVEQSSQQWDGPGLKPDRR